MDPTTISYLYLFVASVTSAPTHIICYLKPQFSKFLEKNAARLKMMLIRISTTITLGRSDLKEGESGDRRRKGKDDNSSHPNTRIEWVI